MDIYVKIRQINEKGPTLAYASVDLDGEFVIRDIRVVEGKNGLFAAMPSRKVKDEFKDICFPCTAEFRERLQAAVLDAYHAALEEQEAEGTPEEPGGGENENE